jgi:dienelactone hydrolase
MPATSRLFDYGAGDDVFEGYLAEPQDGNGDVKRPVVIVCHAWGGQHDFERAAADRLASLGYVAMAADVYGKGKRGETQEDCQALMEPLVGDRAELQARLGLAIETAKNLDGVDASRIAAIGFCFGGLSVLDMARMGADVKGVTSFHGLFIPAANITAPKINAKVLALHGWDDPMATPDDVLAFSKEMTAAGADWTLNAYGNTVHAFTNPAADGSTAGIAYHEAAARRAWAACDDFLAELFR